MAMTPFRRNLARTFRSRRSRRRTEWFPVQYQVGPLVAGGSLLVPLDTFLPNGGQTPYTVLRTILRIVTAWPNANGTDTVGAGVMVINADMFASWATLTSFPSMLQPGDNVAHWDINVHSQVGGTGNATFSTPYGVGQMSEGFAWDFIQRRRTQERERYVLILDSDPTNSATGAALIAGRVLYAFP